MYMTTTADHVKDTHYFENKNLVARNRSLTCRLSLTIGNFTSTRFTTESFLAVVSMDRLGTHALNPWYPKFPHRYISKDHKSITTCLVVVYLLVCKLIRS